MSDVKVKEFKAYLLRNGFTEKEVEQTNDCIATYLSVFGSADKPLRKSLLIRAAENKPSDLSLKIKSLLEKTRRYHEQLNMAFIGYGYRQIAR